jgi:hypothetical protein
MNMTFEKNISIDLIEIVENGCVQVRTKTVFTENNNQISSALHRHVVVPGADYSAEDVRVQAICTVVHTPELIAAYQTKIAQELQESSELT